MTQKLAILAIMLVAILAVVGIARAEVVLKKPCGEYGKDWDCINETQQLPDNEMLYSVSVLRAKIKKKKLKMPRKIIVTPIFSRSGRWLRPRLVNGVLYFPTSGCPGDISNAVEVLK